MKVAPEPPSFPSEARGGGLSPGCSGRRSRFVAKTARLRILSSMLLTHHLLRETPLPPVLAVRLRPNEQGQGWSRTEAFSAVATRPTEGRGEVSWARSPRKGSRLEH